jgi:hypothetical protein
MKKSAKVMLIAQPVIRTQTTFETQNAFFGNRFGGKGSCFCKHNPPAAEERKK